MGRIKKKPMKPWCWYCDREFEDDKVLARHQKVKHFKCIYCHKSLYTGPGLQTHAMQVHKNTILKIENALPGRDDPSIEIFGMEGIPSEDLKAHQMKKNSKTVIDDDDDDEAPPPKKVQPVKPPTSVFPNMGMMFPGIPAPFGGPMPPYFNTPHLAHRMPPMVPPVPYGYPPMNINPFPPMNVNPVPNMSAIPPTTQTPPPNVLFPSAAAIANRHQSESLEEKSHDTPLSESQDEESIESNLAKDLTDDSRLMYSLEDISLEEYRAKIFMIKNKCEKFSRASTHNKTATVSVAPQIYSIPPFPGNPPFNYGVPPMMPPPYLPPMGFPHLPRPPMNQFGFMPPMGPPAYD